MDVLTQPYGDLMNIRTRSKKPSNKATTRWSVALRKAVRSDPKIDKFLAELSQVCKKHSISLDFDEHIGNFVVRPYDEEICAWLQTAEDGLNDIAQEVQNKTPNEVITNA